MSNLQEINLDTGNVKELNISGNSAPVTSNVDLNIQRGSSPSGLGGLGSGLSSSSPRPNLVVDSGPSQIAKEVPMHGIELLADSKKIKSSSGMGGMSSGSVSSGSLGGTMGGPSSIGNSISLDSITADPIGTPSVPPPSMSPSAPSPTTSVHSGMSGVSNGAGDSTTDNILKFLDDTPGPAKEINLESVGDSGTTDGGVNPSAESANIAPPPKIERPKTFEEIQREKQVLLFKFERLRKRGVPLTKQFSMASDLHEMKSEFQLLKKQRDQENSIKFQRKMLVTFCSGVEFLNGKFDPINAKLDGWSESIHENITDYDEVFEELHEKYSGAGEMAPEARLVMMLGGSAFMYHLTNTMFKSSLPGMGDIMKQNPDLMKQFANAAASTMGGSDEPEFTHYMNEMVNQSMKSKGAGAGAGGMGGGGGGGGLSGMMSGMTGAGGGMGGGAGMGGGGGRNEMNAPTSVDEILQQLDRNTSGQGGNISLNNSLAGMGDLGSGGSIDISNVSADTKKVTDEIKKIEVLGGDTKKKGVTLDL